MRRELRLASYNVRYFGHGLKGLASTAKSKRGIAQALAALDPLPDVVALQEVETASIRAQALHRKAHPRETQLEAFLRHLDDALVARGSAVRYRAYYYPAHAYRLGPITLYTTGLAFLVNGHAVDVLKDNAHAPHDVTARPESRLKVVKQTRIAAHLHVETAAGQKLHLFNTHLSLPSPWAKEFWRETQKMGHGKNQLTEAKRVLDYAHHVAHHEPFLIFGDFNSAPATPVYQLLTDEGRLHGAQEVLRLIDPKRPDSFATAGFLKLRMHLDHVFGSKAVSFVDMKDTHAFGDAQGPFHGLSDHVPLVTRFGV